MKMRALLMSAGLAVAIAAGGLLAVTRLISADRPEPGNMRAGARAAEAPAAEGAARGAGQSPLAERLAGAGFALGQPVHLRIYKEERALEIWLARDGIYRRAGLWPICAWSGALGPKLREGDRQAPEGFYTVTRDRLKPDSAYHRAFNLGFPNAHDRANGRTGSFLMVHGACVSIGCYAMTDAGIDDIYRIVEAALDAGQNEVAVHIFPFRMDAGALEARAGHRWHGFWTDLAEGERLFARDRAPPRAFACGGRYRLAGAGAPNPQGCVPAGT